MNYFIKKFLLELNIKNEDVIKNTPKRFINYLKDYTVGYSKNINDIVNEKKGLFKNESKNLEISIGPVHFTSMCQHHLAPYFGKIRIIYKPYEYIIGLSKIPQIIEILSKRLTVQEELTNNITNILIDLLDPLYLNIKIEATHSCMCRKNIKCNISTITRQKYYKKYYEEIIV